MIRMTLLSVIVLLFMVSCPLASELAPVMFVTENIKKDGLAEAQAELARQRKMAAEKMEKAVADGEAAAKEISEQAEYAQAHAAEARAVQAEAARELSQLTIREDALARAVVEANQQVIDFADVLANTIKNELGCAQVIQHDELDAYFKRERELALPRSGTDDDPLDGSNSQEPEAEYEVKVNGRTPFDGDQSGQVELAASCMHIKTRTVLASVGPTMGRGDSLAGLADTFVGQMARFEVCPYLGTVSVTSDLSKTPHNKIAREAYCNNRDGQYIHDFKENSVSKEQWELEKTGRRAASGDVDFTGLEKFDELEEDDCHRCPSGQEGQRVYTKNITKDIKISGLSEESTEKRGETVNKDSRIRIRFLDSGPYYMIRIDAVSKNGTELVDLKENASGVCDTIDRNPPPEKKGRDTHLSGEWGPFRGSPMDKKLADTFEEPLNKPDIGESGKRIIRFELNRE